MLPDDSKWALPSLMAALPDDDRAALLALGNRQHFHDKDVIVLQGGPGDSLYVLLAGVVKITMTTENGTNTTLATRQRGDLIGEVALFDGRPRAATVTAVGEVAALKVSQASFRDFAKRHPAAASTIMKSIVSKIRESDERLAHRSRQAPERLALVLYNLALASTDREPDGSVVIPQVTQGDIARLADAGVATAERFFKTCREQGVLATGYRQLTIRDMSMLEHMATGG